MYLESDHKDVILSEEEMYRFYTNFNPDTYDEDDPDVQMFKNINLNTENNILSSYATYRDDNNELSKLIFTEENTDDKDKVINITFIIIINILIFQAINKSHTGIHELDTKNTEVIMTTDAMVKSTDEKSLDLIGKYMQTINTTNSDYKINRPMTSIKRNLPQRPQTSTNEKASDILFKNNAIQNIIFEDKGSESSFNGKANRNKDIEQKSIEIGNKIVKDIFNINPNKQNLYKMKMTKSNSKNKSRASNKNSTKDFEVEDMMKVENVKVSNDYIIK